MEDYVKEDLAKEEMSDFHKTMLRDCKDLVQMSRKKMGEFYATWDLSDEVYQGKRSPDKDDKTANAKGEPMKMVVPITFSQVDTFVAAILQMFNQKERFYELQGFTTQDHKAAKVGEALLSRDLTHNNWNTKLTQYILDIARFGIGVLKTTWVHEKQRIKQTVTKPPVEMMGLPFGGSSEEVEQLVTKYKGNKIVNISPYRFYPDVRLPLSRYQEGEFCAAEDEFSYISLKQMEADGQVTGIKYVKQMTREAIDRRGDSRLVDTQVIERQQAFVGGGGQSKGTFLVTEVQRTIIPNEYMVNDKPLGPEDYPVKYVITYVNDSRVIKCEPLGYLHDQFTYIVQQFTTDQHHLISQGIASRIDQLQSILTWFINSRIASVKKVIDNRIVVDPEGVQMSDLVDRKTIIRLKPQAGRQGIDRWIKQLDVHDVTAGHLTDAKFLQDMVQITTGITDNAMGQFHQGRRSATEARNVSSGGSARLRLTGLLIYGDSLTMLGEQMLSNLRDGLDEQTFVQLMGIDDAVEGVEFIQVTKADIIGHTAFEIFDGTLPSERAFTAAALEEVLKALMSNPEAAIALQMDPRAMLLEALELRGVRNPKRFTLKAPINGQQQATGQPAVPGTGPNPGQAGGNVTAFPGTEQQPGVSNPGIPMQQ